MTTAIQTVKVPGISREIELHHQLFLGDLKATNHDLTGLKFWPTASHPMLVDINKKYPKESLRIVELGSGCGLLGIGLAACGLDGCGREVFR